MGQDFLDQQYDWRTLTDLKECRIGEINLWVNHNLFQSYRAGSQTISKYVSYNLKVLGTGAHGLNE